MHWTAERDGETVKERSQKEWDGESTLKTDLVRDRGRKEWKDGWMDGEKSASKEGFCSTCDGWALAQVWRRDQIKSLSRQQWTRDKVITFASLPPSLLSLSTSLSLSLSGLSSLYHHQLSAALLSVWRENRPSPLSNVRHISILYSESLFYDITFIQWLDRYSCPRVIIRIQEMHLKRFWVHNLKS